MAGLIRWSKGDYLTLGRAVADFNRKIKKLETEENKLYLPEQITYKQVKETILSRSKLNDVLRSLRSFDQSTAAIVINRQTGQAMTEWESSENIIKQGRAVKVLQDRAKNLKAVLDKTSKYSRKRSQELRLQYEEALENLREIQEAREKSILPYKTYKQMLEKLGDLDYSLIKATVYRQNYMHAIEDTYSNYKGYDLLKSKLDRIQNPKYFYNYVNRSKFFENIFIKYREGGNQQEEFYQALEDTGLVKEEKNRLLRKYSKQDNKEMIKIVESISTAEDLIDFLEEIK